MPALIVLKQPCCLAPTQMVAAEAELIVTAENATHSTARKIRSQAPMCPIPPPIQYLSEIRLFYGGAAYLYGRSGWLLFDPTRCACRRGAGWVCPQAVPKS